MPSPRPGHISRVFLPLSTRERHKTTCDAYQGMIFLFSVPAGAVEDNQSSPTSPQIRRILRLMGSYCLQPASAYPFDPDLARVIRHPTISARRGATVYVTLELRTQRPDKSPLSPKRMTCCIIDTAWTCYAANGIAKCAVLYLTLRIKRKRGQVELGIGTSQAQYCS